MGYMRDWRSHRLDDFHPARDVQGLMAWFTADDLPASGQVVQTWRDRSGFNTHLYQRTSANRPTVATVSGRKVARFGSDDYLANTEFGRGWPKSQLGQPLTFFIRAKLGSSVSLTQRWLIASSASGRVSWGTNAASDALYVNAGSVAGNGGPPVNDGAWHIFALTVASTHVATYTDGVLTYISAAGAAAGGNAMVGLGIGGDVAGLSPIQDADVSDVLIYKTVEPLRLDQIEAVTAWMSQQAAGSPTIPTTLSKPVIGVDATDGNGQALRYWMPQEANGTTPRKLAIWMHPFTQGYQIDPDTGYPPYTLVHTLVNAGYMVVAPNMRGDSWGNANAMTDLAAARTFMHGLNPVSSTTLIGGSMGGLAALNAAARGVFSDLASVYAIDPVCNLANTYALSANTASIDTAYGITRGTLSGSTTVGSTSIPTTASFPTVGTQLLVGNGTANVETVTTTGASNGTSVAVTALTKTHASGDQVSDYPTKTSGYDPMLRATTDWAGKKIRLMGSVADVLVDVTQHADLLYARFAGQAAVRSNQRHLNGHLATNSFWPADVLAFANTHAT